MMLSVSETKQNFVGGGKGLRTRYNGIKTDSTIFYRNFSRDFWRVFQGLLASIVPVLPCGLKILSAALSIEATIAGHVYQMQDTNHHKVLS